MTASRFLLDAIVAASAALLLAWLAGLALRRAPAALRHSVWRIAVLAFWLAPAAAVAADALHLQFCPVPAPPRIQYDRPSPLPPSQLRGLAPWPGASRPTHAGPRAEPVAIQPPNRPSPLALALIAWAAGTVLSAACFLWNLRALARLLRTTSAVPDAALSQRVAHWSARVGLRGPPALARSSALTVPTITGWRKPLLLFPPAFSAEDPSCDAVLVHELAHIRRSDLVAQTAARVTRALWWWHPLAWLAARELHTSAEEACDDWAIALTGQRRTYADHLVRWAEAARTGGALAYTCGGKTLIGRVRRILAQTRAPELRPSRRAAALLTTCALAAILATAVLRAQPTPVSEPAPRKEADAVTVSQPKLAHGFRHDPMEFVENDRSLQGALVRTFVFSQPQDGDAGLIQKRIDETLAEQREDGSFGDTSKDTGSKLLELLQLGLPHDRPEVERAVEALLRQKRAGQNANEWVEKEGALSIYALHALCLLGRSDIPEVQFSLKWYVEHPEEWNAADKGCPWTPEVFWSALWAGREIADTAPTVSDGLRRITDGMNAAGCNSYNDPYGFLDAAGQIDSPDARALVERQIPMILRGQRPDGGWGDHSLAVLRALETHGFLDRLRGLPSLPPDWTIARTIPAPGTSPASVAWDGQSLWVHETEDNSAIAVSPDDGSVVAKLDLPMDNVVAIGWWDGCLAVTQKTPKKLLKVDPTTGEIKQDITIDETDWAWVGCANAVNGKVWVADEFSPGIIVIDPDNPDERGFEILAGPGPGCFTPTPDGVWHTDFWAKSMIKTSYEGGLLDWGEIPFDVRGLAFDGEHLWALDAKTHRLCVIEKAGE